MAQEIRALREKLGNSNSLSNEKLEALQKEHEEKIVAYRHFQDDKNRELSKKRSEVLQDIERKVMPLINEVGKRNGYTAIFRKFESGLLYVDEATDITKVVIQALDNQR